MFDSNSAVPRDIEEVAENAISSVISKKSRAKQNKTKQNISAPVAKHFDFLTSSGKVTFRNVSQF
jgi:hypothetical protein